MPPNAPRDDRYLRKRILGEGGAGRVWLAEDRAQPGRDIALKELTPAGAAQHEEAFRREFATLACLHHPNLVEVDAFDVDPVTGLPRFTLELVVALALVTVGLWNIRASSGSIDSGLGDGAGRPPTGRAFLVGMAHGLAGSAAVALLVLATVRDPRWASLYLLIFGVGTLAGMLLVTAGLAIPLSAVTRRWGGSGRVLRLSTGALSLLFGVWLIYQIGWQDGLFLAVPHWSPH